MLQKPHLLFRDQFVLRHPCDNLQFFQFSPFPEVEREGGNDKNAVGLMGLVCQRSLCTLRAKGSSRKVSVCVFQGGVADNAGSGIIPTLLLPHSSAQRILPFISHSGRGLKVGLIHDGEHSPCFPGHSGPLCSPLTLPA